MVFAECRSAGLHDESDHYTAARGFLRLMPVHRRITTPDNGNGLADACKIVTANGMIGCPNGAAARSEPFEAAALDAIAKRRIH